MKDTKTERRAYEELGNAIIKKAVEDYRQVLRERKKKKIKECEAFFRSGYYRILTKLDAEYLIDRIKAEEAKA